ncbi:MAG: hypothetical protein U0736_17265 [Gemmataceae bacterium]
MWLVVVAGGMGWLVSYKGRAGDPGRPPPLWPASSALPRAPDRPTLLLFVHPRCPCSRATLDELARLMAGCGDRVRTWVVFLHPAGTPADWARSDLWDEAARIPGVTVFDDDAAVETRRFAAATSGQALLYTVDGRLRYNGGLTPARGHAGDNRGRSALSRLLRSKADDAVESAGPVYGCPLFAPAEEDSPS